MKRCFVCFLLVLPLFFLASCDAVFGRDGQSVTILSVGIDYKNTMYVQDLISTVGDAKEFGYALKSQYDRMGIENDLIYMIQEGATSSVFADDYYPDAGRILAMINSLEMEEDDLFVFFYSGHGVSEDSRSSLACATTSVNDYTKLSVEELLDAVEALPCRSVLILDCCYSGGFSNQYANVDPISFKDSFGKLMEGSEYQKVTVLAASRADEKSYGGIGDRLEDGSYDRHGYFTYELLYYLGWDHSSEKLSTYTQGNSEEEITIYGQSSYSVKGLTVGALFDDVMKDWEYYHGSVDQNPIMYGTNVSVCLIPRN